MKMLRLLTLLLTALMAVGSAHAQTTYNVVVKWSNDSTPACTSTVKNFCVIGRSISQVIGGTPTLIAGPTVITPALTTFTTPAATYTTGVTLIFTMVTNYQDGSGAAQVTGNGTCSGGGTSCSVSVFFVLPPSNITVTPVQVSALVEAPSEAAESM